jgi:palmitoyltransferase
VFVLFAIYVAYGVEENYPECKINIQFVYIGYGICALCMFCFYWASKYEPGIITKKNHTKILSKYTDQTKDSKAYINLTAVSYIDKDECSKCKFQKIPRSKHCVICDKCIDKFDHHCIWINQCVGANNYRYFLLFITIHCILCAYASIVGLAILWDFTQRNNLFKVQFM